MSILERPQSSTSLIEVRNLSHHYESADGSRVDALKGVSLDVRSGEFLAIIGHNGSGKSTLAKHLNALLIPEEGDVIVAGMSTTDPENLWSVRQVVGMVFQNPDNQLVATTVEEDVAFGPENLGIAPLEIELRVAESLKAVGLTGLEKRAPHHLSGGQKQRVAIAGILAMRPQCIVLDEPTAMLDPQGRDEVMQAITRVNKVEGKTIVHITHFMEEAAEADRVVVMSDGQIVMEGTPADVFSRAEELENLHLDVPTAAAVAGALRRRGLAVPLSIIRLDQLFEYIAERLAAR